MIKNELFMELFLRKKDINFLGKIEIQYLKKISTYIFGQFCKDFYLFIKDSKWQNAFICWWSNYSSQHY